MLFFRVLASRNLRCQVASSTCSFSSFLSCLPPPSHFRVSISSALPVHSHSARLPLDKQHFESTNSKRCRKLETESLTTRDLLLRTPSSLNSRSTLFESPLMVSPHQLLPFFLTIGKTRSGEEGKEGELFGGSAGTKESARVVRY